MGGGEKEDVGLSPGKKDIGRQAGEGGELRKKGSRTCRLESEGEKEKGSNFIPQKRSRSWGKLPPSLPSGEALPGFTKGKRKKKEREGCLRKGRSEGKKKKGEDPSRA